MAIVSTTVGDIIQDAVSMAQLDSGFYVLARKYYNLILENYARNVTWPYFLKTQTDQILLQGQNEYDLPDDWAKEQDLYLIAPSGQRGQEILILDPYQFDQLDNAANGQPTFAKIKATERKLVFNNSPSSSNYNYKFTYYRLPNAIDTEGANDADTPDFDNPMQLIEEMTARLMKYNDDERQNELIFKRISKGSACFRHFCSWSSPRTRDGIVWFW